MRPAKLDWERIGELLVDALKPGVGFFFAGADGFFCADGFWDDLLNRGKSHEARLAFVAAASGASVHDTALRVLASGAGHPWRMTCQPMWQSFNASM